MNSKLSISKPTETRSLFPKWLMRISAVASVVLWMAWAITKPRLELTMTTWPLYFPEAPLWHIGLYAGAFATMSFSIIGFFGMKTDRILETVHRWLDLLLQDRNRESERS